MNTDQHRHDGLGPLRVLALLIVCVLLLQASAEADGVVFPGNAGQVHAYILAGQSNMAGRGWPPGLEEQTTHSRVFRLRPDGTAELATEPVQYDRPNTGVGPGLALGKELARLTPNAVILLIPVAEGNTLSSAWAKKTPLYERILDRAASAQSSATLAGLFWHQGEGDAIYQNLASTYSSRYAEWAVQLRNDLGSPDLPIVVGEVGRFLTSSDSQTSQTFRHAAEVNAQLNRIPELLPRSASVSSEGLEHGGDYIHFSVSAQRELGRRLAQAMHSLSTTSASALRRRAE